MIRPTLRYVECATSIYKCETERQHTQGIQRMVRHVRGVGRKWDDC